MAKNDRLLIVDSTLRDGSHAMRHQFEEDHIRRYAKAAEEARMPMIVVGHGNGLGASSIQLGPSKVADKRFVTIAHEQLDNTKLAVFLLPGFGTIQDDFAPVEDMVDAVFVASHCSEADVTQKHLRYAGKKGKECFGVLMMSHLLDPPGLLEQARKMQEYGASGILLMDSAGRLLMDDVRERVTTLAGGLDVSVGFHGHNNLGLAVANSIVAYESGARIIDGTTRGFGAGAGNCPLEVFAAAMKLHGVDTGIDLYKLMDISEDIVAPIMKKPQVISRTSLASGMAGVFSGFCPLAERASAQFGVDVRDILMELGRRRIVGGQEDYIIQVAAELAAKKKKGG